MPAHAREKRRRNRVRSRHAAWIKTGPSGKPLPCVLWDQSEKGARIAAAYASKLPSTFTLLSDTRPPQTCRIVWRKASLVGVKFVEAGEPDEPATAASSVDQAAQSANAKSLLPLASLSASPGETPTPRAFAVSSFAAGLLGSLIAISALLFFARLESGAGAAWAAAVCQKATNMCQHPEFSAGASMLMAIVYFAARGMEG